MEALAFKNIDKEQLQKDIKYLIENKMQLEERIRMGKEAEIEVKEKEEELRTLMNEYLGS